MDIDDIFITNIELERARLGYTQTEMAAVLNMTLSRYKKMVLHHVETIPKFEIALALYPYSHKTVYELCGCVPQELKPLIDYNHLPPHRRAAIDALISTELRLYESIFPSSTTFNHNLRDKENYTTCYIVTGNMTDGMLFDAASYKDVYVGNYHHICPESIDFAVEITSNHLHPAYHVGDILLVHRNAPRDGDTGIFIHTKSKRIFVRRFRQSTPTRLEPITPYGQVITIDSSNPMEASEWIKLGYVMTKMH